MPEWKNRLLVTMKEAEKLTGKIAQVHEIIKNGGSATMSDDELREYGERLEKLAVATLGAAKEANKASKMCFAKVSNRIPNKEMTLKHNVLRKDPATTRSPGTIIL